MINATRANCNFYEKSLFNRYMAQSDVVWEMRSSRTKRCIIGETTAETQRQSMGVLEKSGIFVALTEEARSVFIRTQAR